MSRDKSLDPLARGARRFEDKVCVVAGAGQGIGLATVRRLATEGAKIVIGDWAEDIAQKAQEEVVGVGETASVHVGDYRSWEGCQSLMEFCIETYGRIDSLIVIVGGTVWSTPFQYNTPEQIVETVNKNIWPAVWCTRAVLPYMIEQKSGAIVNIATHAVTGRFRVPYAAAKAGQIGLTTSLAREVAHLGIRVNCVAPSGTGADDRITPRNYGIDVLVPELPEEERAAQEKYRVETRSLEVPMGRRGEAFEQASTIAFLASHDASYITGQVLAVGGGQPYPF